MSTQTAPKAPARLITSTCIQDGALELAINNATPDQVASMLRAAWAVSGPSERFAVLKSPAATSALEVADTYPSGESFGYVGCESDCYETECDAFLAALEVSLAALGLEPVQTEARLAEARFLEFMNNLAKEDRLFHLDDSPEDIVNSATGARIFTDAECEQINTQMSAAREALGQELMWDLAWPIFNPPGSEN